MLFIIIRIRFLGRRVADIQFIKRYIHYRYFIETYGDACYFCIALDLCKRDTGDEWLDTRLI